MMCTKFGLILLVTIASFFIAAISFAADQTAVINLANEESKTIIVLPDTVDLYIRCDDCACMSFGIKALIKRKSVDIERGFYKDFEDFWAKEAAQGKNYLKISADFPKEGESEVVSYECYTKEQLKAYYDQLLVFYGKGKDSGN